MALNCRLRLVEQMTLERVTPWAQSRESDDSSQTNSCLEIWIINLRLRFGVLGLGFQDFGLGTSFGDEESRIPQSNLKPKCLLKFHNWNLLHGESIQCWRVVLFSFHPWQLQSLQQPIPSNSLIVNWYVTLADQQKMSLFPSKTCCWSHDY